MTSVIASAVPSRPGLQARQTSSPHTPSRFISSTYSSPGSTFRQEEDAVVIELGARFLRAGFEGESSPQCVIAFGPEHNVRVGDYSTLAPGYAKKPEKKSTWGHEYELWRNDHKDIDLGLLEDKLERAIREVHNKYLLTDAGTARLVLVVPSLLPHPALSSILSLLFERWSYPMATLLPSPTMAAVGAGLRSALVVDIGWEETTVTPIYEYREMKAMRSIRATKMLTQDMERILTEYRKKPEQLGTGMLPVTFEFAEEVTSRLAFCKLPTRGDEELAAGTETISLSSLARPGLTDFEIEWPTAKSSVPAKISTNYFSGSVESVFLNTIAARYEVDDHERPVPDLLYHALLSLPRDVRATCMARVVFVGGGSSIPGLCLRILQEAQIFVNEFGWDSVRGRRIDEQRERLGELAQARIAPPSARHGTTLPPGKDYVEEKLQKQQAKELRQHEQGHFRQVESLGPWAGASLLASLKVKGFVEIDREKFLSHGLSGAHRDVDISVIPQRMSGFGLAAAKATERSSWTLAGWG